MTNAAIKIACKEPANDIADRPSAKIIRFPFIDINIAVDVSVSDFAWCPIQGASIVFVSAVSPVFAPSIPGAKRP